MSGADDSDTWPSLIFEFQSKLGVHEQPRPPVASEAEYRTQLLRLCDEHRERDPQRLISRMRRQHAQVIEFAAAIDGQNQFIRAQSLCGVIWQLLIIAVEVETSTVAPLRICENATNLTTLFF
jgi:hypothetical protein